MQLIAYVGTELLGQLTTFCVKELFSTVGPLV